MRRGFGIGFLILTVLIVIGIGSGAYHVGYLHGLDANGSVQVVHTVGEGGFFPFGFFLFPFLFLFLIFGVGRAAFWGGRHHRGDHGHDHAAMGPGGWGGGRQQMFEDWHRRQHDPAGGDPGSAGGEPAS
jgi:hypothetical protein